MPSTRYQHRAPEHDIEAMKAIEAYRMASTARPLFVWAAALGAAALLHLLLPSGVIAAAVLFLGVCSAVLALWHARRRTDPVHQFLPAVTIVVTAVWVAWADLAGLHLHWTLATWLVFGGFVTFAWVLAPHMGGHHDAHQGISAWFAQAARHTDVPGLRLNVHEAAPGRVQGEIVAPPGTPPDKVAAAITQLESAGDVPLGTLTTSPGATARRTNAVLVHPGTLDEPRIYPGPSLPGGSIAAPLHWGRFADGTEWNSSLFPPGLPGHQLLITGMTGSAKTTGPGYCMLAEAMTRRDAAIIAFDPRKGEQFLGPLRPGLHHLATDMNDVIEYLWRLNLLCRPRMDYLGGLGLPQWTEGCGLTAIVAHVEEAALVLDALGKTAVRQWVLPMVLAMRSAGIFVCLSLQRASWDQIPPVIRAQLHSICMGVHSKADAEFGLSHDQKAAGCNPGKWASAWPGKCFTDMPDLPARYQVMDARTDWWGPDATLIAAHARDWPATDRPLDELSARYLTAPIEALGGLPGRGTPSGPQASTGGTSYPPLRVVPPPSPPRTRSGPDRPEVSEPPVPIPAVRADPHTQLRAWVTALAAAGKTVIMMDDLRELTIPTGPNYIGRTDKWLYSAMAAMAADGLVEEFSKPRRWAPTPLLTQQNEEDEA